MSNDILAMLERIPKFDEKSEHDSENSYNIFEVMGVEYNEVIVCRFIGDLLDPKGRHGLGSEPLRLFIDTVLGDGSSNENLENAMVVLEEHTDNDRRIDIVIHLQEKVYPIEVKIWAGDQDKQLVDYHRYFFGKNGTGKIYYLTPNGHKPSDESQRKLSDDKIHPISFYKDIKNWLNKIQETASGHIKFVIANFTEVINKMNERHTELQSILNLLQLNSGKSNDDYVKSVITLLKYHDEIWDKIRKNYIREKLSHNGCEIEIIEDRKDQKDTTTGISHILMCVKKNNETKAWICAETNLYIVTKKKNGECSSGWTEYNNNYQWRYIDYRNKHIQINVPTGKIFEIEVDLEQLLREIE